MKCPSVRLDDETDLGEAFFFFKLLSILIKGMDEMSVRLGYGTDLGEASLFGFTNMPSLWGGRRGKGPGRG
jgi:hypothetical protein